MHWASVFSIFRKNHVLLSHIFVAPSQPTNISLTTNSSDCIILMWEKPLFSNGKINSYQVGDSYNLFSFMLINLSYTHSWKIEDLRKTRSFQLLFAFLFTYNKNVFEINVLNFHWYSSNGWYFYQLLLIIVRVCDNVTIHY